MGIIFERLMLYFSLDALGKTSCFLKWGVQKLRKQKWGRKNVKFPSLHIELDVMNPN